MRTAIITGFQRFGSYTMNPTEKLVIKLNNEKKFSNHKIVGLIFSPKIFYIDTGLATIKMAKNFRADVIISLGLSSSVKGIRFEKACYNWIENEAYCTPDENKRSIYPQFPEKEKIFANLNAWDFKKIGEAFRANGIPYESKLSNDMGSYCCNALMYRVLKNMNILKRKVSFIFCHIPCTEEAVEGVSSFDSKKMLITDVQLQKTIEILLGSYESMK